jgi:hypothetical protein
MVSLGLTVDLRRATLSEHIHIGTVDSLVTQASSLPWVIVGA